MDAAANRDGLIGEVQEWFEGQAEWQVNETIPLVALAGFLGLGAGLIAAMVSNISEARRQQHRLASEKARQQARARREQYEAAPPYRKAGETLRGQHLASKHSMRAKLARAGLQGADAGEADLRNADLRRATTVEANLEETKPCAADLEEANLKGTTLSDARLAGAELDQKAPSTLPLPDSCEDKVLFALWLGWHLRRDRPLYRELVGHQVQR